MRIVVEIMTPKGMAAKTEKKLRLFLLPLGKKPIVYVNEEDNIIYWEIEDNIKKCLAIQKRLCMFDQIIKNIFNNKMMQKISGQQLSKEQSKELREMLENHTKINIVKEASLQELQESNETFWQKIKRKFRREE